MTARTTFPGTAASGDVLTAANSATLPGGWGWRFSVTSDQTGISSPTDLTGLTTGSITVPASRRYEFAFQLAFTSDTFAFGEKVKIAVLEDGSEIWRGDYLVSDDATTCPGRFFYNPSSGSHTYKLQAAVSGTSDGPMNLIAASGRAAQFAVLDIGPST